MSTMVSLSGFTDEGGHSPPSPAGQYQSTNYATYWIAMARNADRWLYDDGYSFAPDAVWSIYGAVECDSASADSGYASILMLSNSADGAHDSVALDAASADFITVLAIDDNSGNFILRLRKCDGGVLTDGTDITVSADYRNHPLFFKLSNAVDGTLTLGLYRRPECSGTALYTTTVDIDALETLDRFWAMCSYNDSDAKTITGWSGFFYINETPPSIFTESNQKIIFDPDDEDAFASGFPSSDLTWTRGLSGYQAQNSGQTEVDAGGYWAETTTRTTVTAVPINNESYVYKDFGANYFAGSFRHWFDANMSDVGSNAFCSYSPWGVSDDTDDLYGWSNGLAVQMYYSDATHCVIRLIEFVSGSATAYSATTYTAAENTTYYFDVYRNEAVGTYGTLYCDVYASAANRWDQASAVANLVMTLTAQNDFRYLYYGNHYYNASFSQTFSAYQEYLILLSNTSASLTQPIRQGTGSVIASGWDSMMDAYATVSTSATAVSGGVVEWIGQVTSLAENEGTILFGLRDKETPFYNAIVYVQDVSGTAYFRLAYYDGTVPGVETWSTSTLKTCTLNTTYTVNLVVNPGGATHIYAPTWHFLFVDGELVEHAAPAHVVPVDQLFIGGISTAKMGGTRECFSIRYINDIPLSQVICRGGESETFLLYANSLPARADQQWFFSTDNGATWTWFYTDTAPYGQTLVSWCAATNSFWLFNGNAYTDRGADYTDSIRHSGISELSTGAATWAASGAGDLSMDVRKDFDEWFVGTADAGASTTVMTDLDNTFPVDGLIGNLIIMDPAGAADGPHGKVITDNDEHTITTAAFPHAWNGQHYHVQKNCLFYPGSDWIGNTKVLVGGEYLNATTMSASTNYLTSMLFDVSVIASLADNTNPIQHEWKYALYDEHSDPTVTLISEPFLWLDSSSKICGMIRNNVMSGGSETGSVIQSFKELGYTMTQYDAGDHEADWNDHSILEPGRGLYEFGGLLRMFVFQGYCWIQGRRYTGALASNNEDGGWWTFIARVDRTDDASNYLPVSAVYWWPANGLGGNGAITAKANQTGWLILDYASNCYGLGTFWQLTTGQWIPAPCGGGSAQKLIAAGVL